MDTSILKHTFGLFLNSERYKCWLMLLSIKVFYSIYTLSLGREFYARNRGDFLLGQSLLSMPCQIFYVWICTKSYVWICAWKIVLLRMWDLTRCTWERWWLSLKQCKSKNPTSDSQEFHVKNAFLHRTKEKNLCRGSTLIWK